MTRTFLAQASLCAALVLANTAPALAQQYSKQQLQQTYMAHQQTEGYVPALTELGNVRFRREGRNYIILVDEKDPEYFRLSLGFTAEDKSAPARQKRLEAVNVASLQTKVVKATLDGEGNPTLS